MSKNKSYKAQQRAMAKKKKRDKNKRQKRLANQADLLKERQEKNLEHKQQDIMRRLRGNTTTIRSITEEK